MPRPMPLVAPVISAVFEGAVVGAAVEVRVALAWFVWFVMMFMAVGYRENRLSILGCPIDPNYAPRYTLAYG